VGMETNVNSSATSPRGRASGDAHHQMARSAATEVCLTPLTHILTQMHIHTHSDVKNTHITRSHSPTHSHTHTHAHTHTQYRHRELSVSILNTGTLGFLSDLLWHPAVIRQGKTRAELTPLPRPLPTCHQTL